MIDEKETQKEFGYNSGSLSEKSKKKIIAKCDECGKPRAISKYAYRALCPSCSSKKFWKSNNRRRNRSSEYSGRNNPFFGKRHNEDTKNLISKLKKGTNMTLLPGESAKKKVINRYKRSAKNRQLEFSLTENEITNLLKNKCYYCGANPGNTSKHGSGNGVFIYNGIDRKNNNQGYISENCVSCCDICNKAKRNLEYNVFVGWLKRVNSHISEKGIQ